jgi:hypothetical protein
LIKVYAKGAPIPALPAGRAASLAVYASETAARTCVPLSVRDESVGGRRQKLLNR